MISPRWKASEDIVDLFRRVGRASLVYDIQDSHSGNMAVRFKDEAGDDQIVVTATGAQKGDLEPDDICFLPADERDGGNSRASTETNIHRGILGLPGVGASIHAHTKDLTIATLDDDEKPSRPRNFVPIDPLGAVHLGGHIHVDWIAVPSGSPEMRAVIPGRLAGHPATVVQGHGTFARGRTLKEAFFMTCVANHAGAVVRAAARLGVNVDSARERIADDPASFFSRPPEAYSVESDDVHDFPEEAETAGEFRTAGGRIFESRLSPFHTGSMSVRGASRVLYAPKASMPRDLPGPLLRRGLRPDGADSPELRLHKTIYAETNFRTLIHCYLAEAEAHSHFRYPGEDAEADRIVPIDAEGRFLYPTVPVAPPGVDEETLIRLLSDHGVAVVRGGGVWAAGRQALSEALHHPSSLREICLYRIGARETGLDLGRMEAKTPKTG